MPTVAEIITLYLRHCAAEGTHCPAARAERERTLSDFSATYGSLPVGDAKPYHLTDFIEAHPAWRSSSTRRARASYVRAALQWATDQERIDRNPFRSVRYREAERRPDMPDDSLDRIAVLANKPFERALRWLRLTGCRLSELCGAEWEDVDLERGAWTIHRHKSRRKTGKPKIVALVADAVAMLKCLGGGSGPIFLNNRGTRWNRITLGQQLRRMKKRHGIATRATLHGVRHRFGSCAVANGAPIKLVSAQLGHSTVAVTERYYVCLDGEIEALRAAAEQGIPKK